MYSRDSRGPHAQQCGEDDGQEEAAEVDAARQVLGVLLGGARREERGGVGSGGDDVRREQRAGDGDVDGGDVWSAVVDGDDDIDLRARARRGAEALGGVDLGREERLRDGGDEAHEGVVAAMAVAADAAREVVKEVSGEAVEVVAGGDGGGRWVVGAAWVAAEGRWRGGKGERDA